MTRRCRCLHHQARRGVDAFTGTDRLVVVQQLQDPKAPQVLTRCRSAGQQGTRRNCGIPDSLDRHVPAVLGTPDRHR